MRMKKIFFIVIALAITLLTKGQTAMPELISSSGDSFNNSSYQLDWSIGESVTSTHSSDDYVITQGFHQGIYIITSLDDFCEDIKMLAYPNPTNDFISLSVENLEIKNMQYIITDLTGKILASEKITSSLQTINFSKYAVGTYIVSITQNNQLLKSFQIIKK